MKAAFLFLGLSLLSGFVSAEQAISHWSGSVSLEARQFFQTAQSPVQQDNNLSFSFVPEYYQEWESGNQSLTFKPFFRLDQRDNERSHVDIRELLWLKVIDNFEISVGVSKVFWGVTEALHLVDIINQSDFIESLDGEEKLGQPMIKFSSEKDWGTLDLYLLPMFRERTFPGIKGRLRSSLRVATEWSQFESNAKKNHWDTAIRWSHYWNDWDIGLSYFHGTSRDPMLNPAQVGTENVLIPYYEIIDQVGLDLQATLEDWLLKLEMIDRNGQNDHYLAATGGFEYTYVGVMETAIDLGFLIEYMWDERHLKSSSAFQNDLFLGLRLALNDENSSELLAGFIYDLDHQSKTFSVEASKRLSDSSKISLKAATWFDVPTTDIVLSALSQDDYIELTLSKYF